MRNKRCGDRKGLGYERGRHAGCIKNFGVKRRTARLAVGGAGVLGLCALLLASSSSAQSMTREEKRQQELMELQKRFEWWPSDAMPQPRQDAERGGYWWMPRVPGEIHPWGNRGYIYVRKIFVEVEPQEAPVVEEEAPVAEEKAPPPKPEMRRFMLIKKIVDNVKIYFDYNKADLRDDTLPILKKAVNTLNKYPDTNIIISGHCDTRGSKAYNLELGSRRADAVRRHMVEAGIAKERIQIASRGELDAVAPVRDIVGMQKDRNAQFMIAEVEEALVPYGEEPPEPGMRRVGEDKYLLEKERDVTSEIRVGTKKYVVKKGDTLWTIAAKHLGSGHRWRYLYEVNKDKIRDPNKLLPGTTLIIPIE